MSEPTSVAKRRAFESPAELVRPQSHNPDMPRPSWTIVGAVLVVLRVAAGVLWLIALALAWDNVFVEIIGTGVDAATLREGEQIVLVAILVIGTIVLTVMLLLAYLIYRGLNWPRIVVMVFATLSITIAFLDWWSGNQEITIRTTLFTLALDILVLLALSSRPARAYARRREGAA